MTLRTNAHRKARLRGASIASKSKRRPRKLFVKQLSAAIDRGLAPFLAELTPRRYVEWMTTSSVVIGRALKQAILDEQFEQRREARSKADF